MRQGQRPMRALALAVGLCACSRSGHRVGAEGGEGPGAGPSSSDDAGPVPVSFGRARAHEVRRRADERARAYRVGHVPADGREAAALYSLVLTWGGAAADDDCCAAALGKAELEAELSDDAAGYWAAALQGSEGEPPGCRARWERALRMLGPFARGGTRSSRPVNDPGAASEAGAGARTLRVALDPGHGGTDPGAIGPSGVFEKDVTLDVARRAAKALKERLATPTLLTRDDDLTVPVEDRASLANAFRADLFISIHCNASETQDARGAMTFVLDAAQSEVARRVAARENAVTHVKASALRSIAASVRLSELGARSARFAVLLQRATASSIPGVDESFDLGVQRAAFYVLVGARMPAVLYELDFISNPAEERLLAVGEYRQAFAEAIVSAVNSYEGTR